MIAAFVGLILAGLIIKATNLTWILVIAFWFCALALQVTYAHRLNSFLGGEDPVVIFGARNLKQLKSIMSLPFSVTMLHFSVKVMCWAGGVALLFSIGWLGWS